MKPKTALRALTLVLGMSLQTSCGETIPDQGEPIPTRAAEKRSTSEIEAVKVAHGHLQKGEVAELRALLTEDRSIANTLYREDSLLNIVIDTRPEFPRMHASIRALLEAGADPNLKAPQLLRKAIWRGDPVAYGILLDYGADPTIVWTKRNVDMLTYSRSKGDARFDEITDAWEEAQRGED